MKGAFLKLTFLLIFHCSHAQVGIGTTNPEPSSILDVQSNDKGVLIPRIALNDIAQASIDGVNTAAEGLMIYNINAAVVGGGGIGFYFFNGSLWEQLVPQSKVDQLWKQEGGNIERQSGDVYIGNTTGTNNDLYISNALIDWDDPNYRLDPAAINKVNEIEFDDGSDSDPSIRFDDTTTGFFSPDTDELGYSINSTEHLRLDSMGQLGLNTALPQARLDVNGNFSLGEFGTVQNGLVQLSEDFGVQTLLAGESRTFILSGTNSSYNIPMSSVVSLSFQEDFGNDILIQTYWMESDAVKFRLYNKATTDTTVSVVARYLFVW